MVLAIDPGSRRLFPGPIFPPFRRRAPSLRLNTSDSSLAALFGCGAGEVRHMLYNDTACGHSNKNKLSRLHNPYNSSKDRNSTPRTLSQYTPYHRRPDCLVQHVGWTHSRYSLRNLHYLLLVEKIPTTVLSFHAVSIRT